jgi:hypothetical protein
MAYCKAIKQLMLQLATYFTSQLLFCRMIYAFVTTGITTRGKDIKILLQSHGLNYV